ncbi:MAG: insulinase family protein [Acidobacteria bacterium]|nr:insulinase family protein [Acidobacteriota bacterium]MBV9477745.1 insulinase family protein [Acidobacteriota bacterium]
MKPLLRFAPAVLVLAAACATTPKSPATSPVPEAAAPQATPAPETMPAPMPASQAVPTTLTVPVEYHKLDNGLKVVLSPDHTAPTVTVGVYYGIGFRVEPRDRTGFAHLFEHLMFQGSQNLGKMQFIQLVQSNGGVLNGSTRFDFTNYFEIVPAHTLETVLWAEADRMKGLAITADNLQNQKDVVKNEVRVNVLNQPFGGFPWLNMPQHANTNWYNAHNFYGDLTDLDAATLQDATSFFKTYYAPNNAAMAITGDFEPAQALALVTKYFGGIAAQTQPPKADITEPRQTEERRATETDDKATRPALAVAWHAPVRNTPEYYAMGIIDQILASGKDSWLYQDLVQKRGLTGEINSSMNILGGMFDIQGPTLYTAWLFHDKDKSADDIVRALDENITRLQTQPVDAETLARARVKMRSSLYDEIESVFGFGRANLLASFALFDDNPQQINQLETQFAQVTPELIQRTAQEYLRPTNRTILTVVPKQQ